MRKTKAQLVEAANEAQAEIERLRAKLAEAPAKEEKPVYVPNKDNPRFRALAYINHRIKNGKVYMSLSTLKLGAGAGDMTEEEILVGHQAGTISAFPDKMPSGDLVIKYVDAVKRPSNDAPDDNTPF